MNIIIEEKPLLYYLIYAHMFSPAECMWQFTHYSLSDVAFCCCCISIIILPRRRNIERVLAFYTFFCDDPAARFRLYHECVDAPLKSVFFVNTVCDRRSYWK